MENHNLLLAEQKKRESVHEISQIFIKKIIPLLIRAELTNPLQIIHAMKNILGDDKYLLFTMDINAEEKTSEQLDKLETELCYKHQAGGLQ